MNKAKLEVTRINEDVITTSTIGEFCTNHTTHYVFSSTTWNGTNPDVADYVKYYYDNGWKKEVHTNDPVPNLSNTANIELDPYNTGYYYRYNGDGSGLRFCNDTDGHHPEVFK